ncbi:hypothetical protein [Dokdonia sp. PRO95]|nr:hypothetical protein [Dokdonia sp. PRO95]
MKIAIGMSNDNLSVFDNCKLVDSNSLKITKKSIIFKTIDPKYKNPI